MLEELSILCLLNRTNWRAEDTDPVLLENSTLGEFHSAVERRLPPEAEKNAIGPLLSNDLFNVLCGYGKEVYCGSGLGVCLNRSDVRIDQYALNAFLP